MGSSKETGQKRAYIRAYQFAYSRIDAVEGDPSSHTAKGVIASNLRGEVANCNINADFWGIFH